jgi:HTH-type transcriptional regulator / antitoxin HigA
LPAIFDFHNQAVIATFNVEDGKRIDEVGTAVCLANTQGETKLIELLLVLVKDFEARHYPVQASGPLDVIRHLMEENHLRQKDLVDVFLTESIVSDVLNGKRDLTKDHIRKLSARFGVSPALFF